MKGTECFTALSTRQIDLRTGLPYANLIRSQRLFSSMVADYFGVDSSHVLPTPGATGAIEAVRNHIFRIALKTHPVLLTVSPGYWRARESFQGFGFTVVEIETAADGFEIDEQTLIRKAAEVRPDLVYLSLPNNPTGAIFDPAAMMNGMPTNTAVMFDLTLPSTQLKARKLTSELYRGFHGRKLFIVGSTSKSHNTAESRIGWAISACSEDADQLNQENRNVVSSIAVEEGCRALREKPPVHASIQKSFYLLKKAAALDGFQLIEPQRRAESSYVLIRLRGNGTGLRNSLEQLGITVMWGAEFGLTNEYVRLETSQPENVEAFASALTASLTHKHPA